MTSPPGSLGSGGPFCSNTTARPGATTSSDPLPCPKRTTVGVANDWISTRAMSVGGPYPRVRGICKSAGAQAETNLDRRGASAALSDRSQVSLHTRHATSQLPQSRGTDGPGLMPGTSGWHVGIARRPSSSLGIEAAPSVLSVLTSHVAPSGQPRPREPLTPAWLLSTAGDNGDLPVEGAGGGVAAQMTFGADGRPSTRTPLRVLDKWCARARCSDSGARTRRPAGNSVQRACCDGGRCLSGPAVPVPRLDGCSAAKSGTRVFCGA
jgi:hypothetical protein